MKRAQAGGRVLVRAEKIVLIGAASSGKTSLVNRFAHDRFQPNSEATIGAAFISKTVTVGNSDIKLEIWDTGGTEKYKSLAPMYYRDARAAVIVFDVTNEQSFTEAAEWLSEFRERGQPSAIVVAAANKIDLEAQRRVSTNVANDFAFQSQLDFIKETSALSGQGVKELFNDLAKQLLGLPPVDGCNVAVTEDVPRYGQSSRGGCDC
jgi:small GTP-binding protein